jgi:hypothetical protein
VSKTELDLDRDGMTEEVVGKFSEE